MSAATDRHAELELQIKTVASEIAVLKEQRATLITEQYKIGMDLHRKKMRKRKWGFVTRNSRGAKFPYGTKVAIRHHTRKSKHYEAGAWVSKTQTTHSDRWVWFAYRDLGIDLPSNIGLNRQLAKIF